MFSNLFLWFRRPSDFQIGTTIFLFALCKAVLFSFYGLGLADEGESLHNALRILSGELPYKDFFAVFSPLHNYFYAFTFLVFGKSIILPRILASFIFAFSPLLLFLTLRGHVKKLFAIVPAVMLIFFNINVERWLYFTPLFMGVYLFDSYIVSRKKLHLIFSGFFLGLTGLFRIDMPGAFLVAFAIGILISNYYRNKINFLFFSLRNILFLGLGSSVPVILMIVWMLLNGIAGDFIDNALIKSIAIEKVHNIPFPRLIDLIPIPFSLTNLSKTYTAVFGYSVLVTYIYIGLLLIKGWKDIWLKNTLVGTLFLVGIFMFPYLFGRSDFGHLVKGGIPFLFLAAYCMHWAYMTRKRILLFVISLAILGIFLGALSESVWWIKFNDQVIVLGGNTLRVNSAYIKGTTIPSANTLKEATEYLQQNSYSNEPVLILPYMAALYYLADKVSPIRFDNVLAGYISSDKEDEFIHKIESAGVKLIVYDPENGPKMELNRLPKYNPHINQYIINNYMVVRQTQEGWLFMRRK